MTGDELATAINAQIGGGSTVAAYDSVNGNLTFTSPTSGAGGSLAISGFTATGATGSGIADTTAVTGADAVAADAVSFTLNVDGTDKAISISAASLTAYNGDAANASNQITDAASALSGADVAKLINYQAGSNVATFDGTAKQADLCLHDHRHDLLDHRVRDCHSRGSHQLDRCRRRSGRYRNRRWYLDCR